MQKCNLISSEGAMQAPICQEHDETFFRVFGLSDKVRQQVRDASGYAPTVGYQFEEHASWRSTQSLDHVHRLRPLLVTNTWRAPDPDDPENERSQLHAADGLWVDLDVKSEAHGGSREAAMKEAVQSAVATREALLALGIDPLACSLFASGSKGFHVFVPGASFLPGPIRLATMRVWPHACRWFVLHNLQTNATDTGIYSGGKGRQLRSANVQRANGKYKVPMTWQELEGLDVQSYDLLVSKPRPHVELQSAKLSGAAAVAWTGAVAEATRRMGLRKESKPAPAKTVDMGKLHQALRTIRDAISSGELSYPNWIKLGSALKATGQPDALDTWIKVSNGYPRFKEEDCRSRWGGLGGCSVATVFWLAQQVRKGGAA